MLPLLDHRPDELTAFPTKLSEMSAQHRFVLALVVAHRDTYETSVPRRVLLSYVSRTAGRNGNPFIRRELPDALMAVLSDLNDYGVLVTSVGGLDLSQDAERARRDWNGPFKELVKNAKTALNQ